MLRDVAVAEVQLILGRRSDLVQEIINALQYSQSQREQPGITFSWWMEGHAIIQTVVGTDVVGIPNDFIQIREEKDVSLWYRASGARKILPIQKMNSLDAAQAFYGRWQNTTDTSSNVPPGLPKAYALIPGFFAFFPLPDAAYDINVNYWKQDAVLTSNIENNWLRYAPWLLIGDAARKIGANLENASAVSQANEILARAETDRFRAAIHHKESGRTGRHIGSKL